MTADLAAELHQIHSIQDDLFWWRYHRRLAQDIYCDSATEHEWEAANFKSQILERIRWVRARRRQYGRMRVAA